MSIRLQQFGYKESRYERPNQKWVCGWAAEGRPCKIGPDGRGRCSAEAQSKCEPVKKGDRWYCTRPEVFGGPCECGPRPDGSCCRPEPEHPVCQPRLSLRGRRGRLTWACCAVALGALAVVLAGPWGPDYLSPGPLASHHAVIEANVAGFGGESYCAKCHEAAPQAGGLLQPVTDQACLQCHPAEAHHPNRSVAASVAWPVGEGLGTVAMAQRCTDCHTEHRRREHDLRRVADRACTQCHADLGKWRRDSGSEPGTGHTFVSLPPVQPALVPKAMDRVTSFATDHPEARVLTGERIDTTAVRFEHDVHLASDEQMQQRLAAWAERVKKPIAELPVTRTKEGQLALNCNACHQADVAGRYMRPINFETHCIQCHDLGSKAVGDRDAAIPHGAAVAQFVRQVAVETVAAEASEPDKKPEEEPKSTGPKRGPGGRGPGGARPSAQPAKPKPLAERIADETRKLTTRLSTSCGKCHDPAANPLEIADPAIPHRWMPGSVFGHAAHRFMSCTDCHAQVHAKPDAGAAPDTSPLKWTGRTKEIMLPTIQSCRECHSPSPRSGATLVRHDCVLCHDYHTPTPSPVRDLTLAAPTRR